MYKIMQVCLLVFINIVFAEWMTDKDMQLLGYIITMGFVTNILTRSELKEQPK